MLQCIVPKLLNVSSFTLALNTPPNSVKSLLRDGTPAPETLASAFESSWMVMPALRSFSLQDSCFHVSIISFLLRHPFLTTLHLHFANFDFFPIPDLVTGGSLQFLHSFTGSLPNVNIFLELWQTPVSVITVIGGRSSEHEFQRFLDILPMHVLVRTLTLSENGGYPAADVRRLLNSCCNLTSLTFNFNCSIWAERLDVVLADVPLQVQWEDTVLACINLHNLSHLKIQLFISDAQGARDCCATAMQYLLSTNDIRTNLQPLTVVFTIPECDVYSVLL
ncbi:hypothetical protein HHX47_DHR3000729 [Lentinula edodes]|nr:hypothetical protein HHX47_DHR3000729 [Lentinula edodes]